MIRSVGPSQNGWVFKHAVRTARNGPQAGALGQQLSALRRRRLLSAQQEDLQAGSTDYPTLLPYWYRPRPPS